MYYLQSLTKFLARGFNKHNFFNINPFNGVYFGMLAIMVLIIVVLSIEFKNKSLKAKKNLILGLCYFNIVFWILYKVWLFTEPKVLMDAGYEGFIFLKELPFHLCNISMFLVPIGILLENKTLHAYAFYISVLGAILAISSPTAGFYDSSIFALHNIGFYGTHLLIIINGILPVTLGLFRPSFKIIPKNVLLTLGLMLATYALNVTIKATSGIEANYFYTVNYEGISALKIFWRLAPVSVVYELPILFILTGVMYLETIPFWIVDKKNEANEEIAA